MEDFLGSHRSRPYNPLIANAFYRAGFIESWGRGIQKISEACLMAGNKGPSYQIKKDEITIVFEAKSLIEGEKPSIEEAKPSIEARKKAFLQIIESVEGYSPSLNNLVIIFDSFYDAEFFCRKDIMEVCSVQISRAGDFLSKLKEIKVIEPVVGHGKGKYRFII